MWYIPPPRLTRITKSVNTTTTTIPYYQRLATVLLPTIPYHTLRMQTRNMIVRRKAQGSRKDRCPSVLWLWRSFCVMFPMALCFASGFFWTDSESVVNSDNKVDEDADADTDAAGDIRKSGTQVITSNAATMKDSSSMFSPAGFPLILRKTKYYISMLTSPPMTTMSKTKPTTLLIFKLSLTCTLKCTEIKYCQMT